MRLTDGMLDAMLNCLCEVEAGEGPAAQGLCTEAEAVVFEKNLGKAKEWIHEQQNRRAAKKARS